MLVTNFLNVKNELKLVSFHIQRKKSGNSRLKSSNYIFNLTYVILTFMCSHVKFHSNCHWMTNLKNVLKVNQKFTCPFELCPFSWIGWDGGDGDLLPEPETLLFKLKRKNQLIIFLTYSFELCNITKQNYELISWNLIF